jgi:hypothetical protein
MRSNTSKPSSDAGLRPIRDFVPAVLAIISRAKAVPARASVRMNPFDKQTAVACLSIPLAGRRGAPTWGPTQWGGEGTTSRAVSACKAVSARRA